MKEITIKIKEVEVVLVGDDSFLVMYKNSKNTEEIPFTKQTVLVMLENADDLSFLPMGQ